MGKPKESLPFADSTLLGNVTELLLECTWPVIIVDRGDGQELPPLPLEATVIHDDTPDAGPLAAMATGMRHLRTNRDLSDQDAVFVTGCDAPFLTSDAIAWLSKQLGDKQVVMPRTDDKLQPLCAVYRMTCLPVIEQLLRDGTATPRSLAELVPTHVIGDDELAAFDPELRFLTSLNTPEEYEQARRLAGSSE